MIVLNLSTLRRGERMSKYKDMQTSVSVSGDRFTEDILYDLESAGIHYIEYTGGKYPVFEDFVNHAPEIAALAKLHGVTVRSVHLPFSPFREIDPAHAEKSVREGFLRVQTRILDAAARAGIDIAVVHPSGEPYEESERGLRMEYAADSLKALKAHADGLGIRIAIENLPRTCLGRDISDMLALLGAADGLYACFDTNHSLKDDNAEFIRSLGNKIIATHVSDYDFVDEKHWLPGEGKNDWRAIISALEQTGYTGTWNFEVFGYPAAVYAANRDSILK